MDDKTISSKAAGTEASKSSKVQLNQEDLCHARYLLVKQWRSDTEFIEDELNLFRFLIDKYLAELIDTGNVEHTRSMVTHVTSLSNERAELLRRIEEHGQRIRALLQYPVSTSVQEFEDEHQKLEFDFAGFIERFRTIKVEVFSAVERIIRSEKARNVIDWG